MTTPQDKYFKDLAEIYADYADSGMAERAIFRGLQMGYMLGVSDGKIEQLDKQLKNLTNKSN